MRVMIVNDKKHIIAYKIVHETYSLNRWGYPEFDEDVGMLRPGREAVFNVRVQDESTAVPFVKFWEDTVLISYVNFTERE